MAFAVRNLSVDLIHGQANLFAIDDTSPVPGHAPKTVQVGFPFDPPNHDGTENDKAIAAAKAVLQQVLNEI
jgi:hypothetical protein